MPLLHLISMKNYLVTLNLFKILFLKIMVERSNKLMNVPVDLFCEKQLSGLVRGKWNKFGSGTYTFPTSFKRVFKFAENLFFNFTFINFHSTFNV